MPFLGFVNPLGWEACGVGIWGKMAGLFLGRRVASAEKESRQIGVFSGVPSLRLDALASASYGPEAALMILLPLGAAGPDWLLPIMLMIVVVIPEVSPSSWLHAVLHHHQGAKLTARLLLGGQGRIAVINVPWFI